ncbi:hypothetical protein PQJ75_30585 [Rhodoplanes sp. TEM]|uniref:Uncharacterized protein n=1 Tax=Rhodoplanes tepidamans TaxID=200616 RepID=A0ABT5JBV0_RHOTP|nr:MULTISPECIES: hypothetical protein [Rhodoplanes]MDC7787109.1 hypothetical protein [Rhodoplanes tepidamans]MDC7988097.1 hypothetical protein [Rhodoplanes sp. TEM]MDQ0358709.1 hypothetical protein [Rhodoplanes tepidamans]
MAHHLVEKDTLIRANRTFSLGLVWGGLAVCVMAAAVYDVGHWVGAW